MWNRRPTSCGPQQRLISRALPGDCGRHRWLLETRVLPGQQPASVILDEARARVVDLIALETHGRRGLARLLLGSVADKVVRRRHHACAGVQVMKRWFDNLMIDGEGGGTYDTHRTPALLRDHDPRPAARGQ